MDQSKLINLLSYSIVKSDKDAIISLIPESMNRFEIAQLVIGVYSKAIDHTVTEIKEGIEKKREMSKL